MSTNISMGGALTLGALGLGAFGLCACHREPSQNESAPAVRMGMYRAVLTLPGGELPFGLDLVPEGAAIVGYLVNGSERVKLDEVTVAGSHLQIRMPGYEGRLVADAKGDELQGEIVLDKLGGKQQHIPLRAQRGQEFRFFAAAASGNADLSGRWAVNFIDDGGGKPEAAVGEFTQSHDVVSGTFLTDTGDHRFLAGQVTGDELYLSTFDGAHVSDKDEAAKKLPMLDHVYAFPTTIFIDRRGEVRKIHTGFSGPATGDHYTQFVDEVKATLDQLLAES